MSANLFFDQLYPSDSASFLLYSDDTAHTDESGSGSGRLEGQITAILPDEHERLSSEMVDTKQTLLKLQELV